MTAAHPIDTAPAGDGWILALDMGLPPEIGPWAVATRCDSGWRDGLGYPITPTAWAALPAPQPAPTGWQKATGIVKIIPTMPNPAMPTIKWMIAVITPDGVEDLERSGVLASNIEQARAFATKMAKSLGLPVEESRPLGCHLAFSKESPNA